MPLTSAARHLIDNHMDEDESRWDAPAGDSLLDDDHYHEDEDMDESDHDDDDEGLGFGARGSTTYDRLSRLADGGSLFDEAAAAAIFGGDFRGFGGMMSGLSSRFKRLKADLRSPKAPTRLHALRECSELLLVSNEDTLGASFSTSSFATEFIAILNGKPNVDQGEDHDDEVMDDDEEMDEDAQLAAALAMSSGGFPGDDDQEKMEAQLLACRCLAHLMEALPGSGHTLVHLGAVQALCSKLKEISYIELAEQTLSVSDLVIKLITRQWRRSPLSTQPPLFAKVGSLHFSTSYHSSRPMFSAQPSQPLLTAVATSPTSTFPWSAKSSLSFVMSSHRPTNVS